VPGPIAQSGREGVVVIAVEPQGSAATHGIETGDVILDVGGAAVKTPADFDAAIAHARQTGKRMVMMRVRSGETNHFVAVPVG
jgi:serine protease Do